MDDNFDDVAINTFKNSFPVKHGLRKSLTGKPVTSVRQLMDQIDKYKRVEEDQLQGKGKEKVIPQEMRDFRSDRYNSNRSRRDFVGQSGVTNAQIVSGLGRAFICHHLNINPSITPKKQPPWHPSKKHTDTIKDEVMKFKCVGVIKEVFYPDWLANTLVVKKKSGK